MNYIIHISERPALDLGKMTTLGNCGQRKETLFKREHVSFHACHYHNKSVTLDEENKYTLTSMF